MEKDIVELAHGYLADNAAESGADSLIASLVEEVESLRRNLASRDDFLGSIGQWGAYVASLPPNR